MKRKAIAIAIAACAAALALAACAPEGAGQKPLAQYAMATPIAHDGGSPVAIRGRCYNSCILQLASPEVYIDPAAVFSARVSWPGYRADDQLTAAGFRAVPACARAVLNGPPRSAFDPLARVYGSQILAACADMKKLASS